MRTTSKAILGTVTAVALFAGLVLVGWQLGWWFTTQNAKRQAHVIRQGYSNQQTLREQVTKNIGEVLTISTQISQLGETDPPTTATLKAQRKAILSIVCQQAEQVSGDPLPTDQAQFVGANCTLGSVSPNSPYNG